MTFDIDISNINTKEPVIAQWALRRIENMGEIDKKQAREMENCLFTDDVIEKLLGRKDIPFLLSRMIQVLRAEKFKILFQCCLKSGKKVWVRWRFWQLL